MAASSLLGTGEPGVSSPGTRREATERARRLVIISLPLFRIARVSMSDAVLGRLRRDADVLVVAPFADDPALAACFGGANTTFLKWHLNPLSRRQRALLTVSEIMRRFGYWRRLRDRGMAYYARNRFTIVGEDGRDTRMPAGKRVAYGLLAWLGQWPWSWRLTDRLLGSAWARFPDLERAAARYEQVTLLQSANWGEQDRALARLSRSHGWRTMLLPYTTDQLDSNGYLLNRFDAVCVQGPWEEDRARRFHGLPESRLRRLGSAWFRHLDLIQRGVRDDRAREPADADFVLYAGVSNTYFPRSAEFESVDALHEYLRDSGSPYQLVYRPFEMDQGRREIIRRRYEGVLTLQWPGLSEGGLGQAAGAEQEAALRRYVQGLSGCRVLVMSNTTTLALDVAYLEHCSAIANRYDPEGVLRRRHTELVDRSWSPCLRVAQSLSEMLRHVQELLENPALGAQEARDLVALWDYAGSDFEAGLLEAVHGAGTVVPPC